MVSAMNAIGDFRQKNPQLVIDALDVLAAHWKDDYESLNEEAKSDWHGCYHELWLRVGKEGSIPAIPADLPADSTGQFKGQGRTAFDLLRSKATAAFGPYQSYDELPLPMLWLRQFSKLKPSKGTFVESLDSNSSLLPGKVKPDTYPWLSFGILERHLKKHHLHPLAIAMDLSKTNETIIRDLTKIINDKRTALGICIADRRIRPETFTRIKDLDREVFSSDKSPPLKKTVKSFEDCAQLDFGDLLYQIQEASNPSK
jgi:hypothetical protein